MVVHRRTKYRDMLSMEKPWEGYDVVWTDPRGAYDIVRVQTEWDYGLEGYFLAHCLATKDVERFERVHRVYSLRDKFKIPHCTILCAFADKWSEYGRSADLGTTEPFWPEYASGPELNVLQVRGREDAIAMVPYHSLVRQWYELRGGKLTMSDSRIDDIINRPHIGDTDYAYHFQYKLDESVNHFSWAYHNVGRRAVAQADGTSL